MKKRVVGIVGALLLALVGTILLVTYVRDAEERALAAEATRGTTPAPQATAPAVAPVDAGALGGLLAATRESLAAFTANQEQAASVHRDFLKAHATATETFARLFESHARLEPRSGSATAVHRARKAHAERPPRKLQRQVPRRMLKPSLGHYVLWPTPRPYVQRF